MDFQTRYQFNPKADLIGKGGFSKVYKAYDTLLERTVALKFFNATALDKYQVLSEVKRVIRFEHPNLCKYYDVAVLTSKNVMGEVEQAEVGIMEYLDAGDFKTFTSLYPAYIDKLLVDVLEGLSYLHRKGVVHRDLKPQNILVKMVDDEPVAKITDFGISKVIDSGDNNSSNLIGTIEYMAPEQFNPKKYGIGGRITTNLDLWSFGHLVYETIQREPLFGSRSTGISTEQVMTNILGDAAFAKIELLPPKYREVVRRCLIKDAAGRAQHAHELIPLLIGDTLASFHNGSRRDTMPIQDFDTREIRIALQQDAEDTGATAMMPGQKSPDGARQQAAQEDVTMLIDRHPEDDNNATQLILPKAVEESSLTDERKPPIHGFKTPEDQPATMVLEKPNTRRQHKRPAFAFLQGLRVRSLQGGKLLRNRLRPVAGATTAFLNRNKRAVIATCSALLLLVILLLVFNQRPKNTAAPQQAAQLSIEVVPEKLPKLPEMVLVSGAVFEMGKGAGKRDAYLVHAIQLDSFGIGKTEVTVDEFREFVNETGYVTFAENAGESQVYDTSKREWKPAAGVNWRHDMYGNPVDEKLLHSPVVHVSWNDAMKYCEWLSGKEQKTYRLPTEAEWEFAAKGGTRSKGYQFSGSNNVDEVAWYGRNSGYKSSVVKSKMANELGIYDMSGNVMEWCLDWFDPDFYQYSGLGNPKGPENGKFRVVRGGSWYFEDAKWLQNTYRAGLSPEQTGGQLGFRVCVELNKPIKP